MGKSAVRATCREKYKQYTCSECPNTIFFFKWITFITMPSYSLSSQNYVCVAVQETIPSTKVSCTLETPQKVASYIRKKLCC